MLRKNYQQHTLNPLLPRCFIKLEIKAGVKLPKGVSASFAKALKGKDVNSFYAVSGGGSSAPVAADTKKADVKKEDKKAAVPEPEPEEENVDMGGLFD